MPATTTVRDLLGRASTLLRDIDPQWTKWSEWELVSWANDGQLAICKYLPSACTRHDAIRLQPGTFQTIDPIPAANCKPLDGSTRAAPVYGVALIDVPRNMGASGTSPGRAVRVVDKDDLDTASDLWHQSIGTEVRQFTFNPQTPTTFFVQPGVPVGATQVWVHGVYAAKPDPIPNTGTKGGEIYSLSGTNNTLLSIQDTNCDDLLMYVIARAHMRPGSASSADTAAKATAMFTGSINAQVQALTGNNPNLKMLPMVTNIVGQAS